MNMRKVPKGSFYITTTLPYVNAAPHIGFALEIVQADVIARHKRLQGNEVVFNTGTDEHGLKIYRAAVAEKKDPQQYVDENAAKFDRLKSALNLSYTDFIRTTDSHHVKAAQEFWKLCAKKGDIEKKLYTVKYCVGCELEKTESELTDGKCPIHPNPPLEEIKEENYFFAFSWYQKQLLDFYAANPDFVVPQFRFNEIKNFVANGLSDFSISRLKEKMPWGVPVPGDEDHVMYVWFDALVNYISTLGWPEDMKRFNEFWPGVQIAGKDNLRQQSAMWTAMLMSAGLLPSKQIIIHGFITSNGEKMSKSLGNVVDPFPIVETYGTDALRHWLLAEMSPFEDGDFTIEKFKVGYTAQLANGLGNFTARVLTLGEALDFSKLKFKSIEPQIKEKIEVAEKTINEKLDTYAFNEAFQALSELVRFGDGYVNEKKPWAEKDEVKKTEAIFNLLYLLHYINELLQPFLPETSEKIASQLHFEEGNVRIKKGEVLFPRLHV